MGKVKKNFYKKFISSFMNNSNSESIWNNKENKGHQFELCESSLPTFDPTAKKIRKVPLYPVPTQEPYENTKDLSISEFLETFVKNEKEKVSSLYTEFPEVLAFLSEIYENIPQIEISEALNKENSQFIHSKAKESV